MLKRLYDFNFMIKLPFVLTIIATFIMYPSLPWNLPMQFSGNGGVNWTMPKLLGVWLLPIICILILNGYRKGNGVGFTHVVLVWIMLLLNFGFLFYIAYLM